MARGGARQGKPGTQHLNRTDLNVAKLPATAAPGQTYGQAGQQLAAQSAVPMGQQPTTTPGAATPPTAAPGVTPGSLGPLTAPTARPDEPLTAGAPFGAGPNQPPTAPAAPDPVLKGLAILNTLGDRLPPELKQIAQYLNVSQQNQIRQ
jgi:hypothetical protein